MENFSIVRKMVQKGAFGEIYVVSQKGDTSKATFVLKRMKLSKLSPEQTQQLHNEVHIHHKLNRGLEGQHENIVRFKESFVDRRVYGCIVLEHCKGGDLASKVNMARKKNELLEEDKVLGWFAQTAAAVRCMHGNNILHRDIKLENCFLSGGSVKLGDFGLAVEMPEGATEVYEACGTVTSMAPELLPLPGDGEKRPVGSVKSDVWALGALLYELCAQGKLFDTPVDSFGLGACPACS